MRLLSHYGYELVFQTEVDLGKLYSKVVVLPIPTGGQGYQKQKLFLAPSHISFSLNMKWNVVYSTVQLGEFTESTQQNVTMD